MFKKDTFLITVLFLFLPFFVIAEPCYPGNPPGCHDVCGDEICGNQEGYYTCPEDCDHCVSSDGDDIYTKGDDVCEKDTEAGQSLSYISNVLFEKSCLNERGIGTGPQLTRRVECEFGCEDGACLKEKKIVPGCIDEDGGLDYYKRATVESGEWIRVDSCVDATRGSVRECQGGDCVLAEFTCGDVANPIKEENYKCPVGCKDGACIKCSGCIKDEKCFDYGTVMANTYCDQTNKFLTLKPLGTTCKENYECENNNCSNNVCSPGCDEGCLDKSFNCLPFGSLVGKTYCDKTGEFLILKSIGDICKEDYECQNNNCCNNKCSPECESGCLDGLFNCLPFGSIVGDEYCDFDNTLKKQKEDNKLCEANYECKNDICENNTCKNPNPLKRIGKMQIIIISIAGFLIIGVIIFLIVRRKQAK